MEKEHVAISKNLKELKLVTGNFTAPDQSPDKLSVLYKMLQAMYEKIEQHIYLENNVLFPRTLILAKDLTS